MLSAALLVSSLYIAAGGDDVGVLPNGRASIGHSGRFGVNVGPLFSGQLLAGFGVILPTDRKFAAAIMPQLGGGFDTSDRFVSSYAMFSLGAMFGWPWFAVGYRPGFIIGVDRVRHAPITGVDRLRGMHGFHHGLELRGFGGFWGVDVQHDVFVQPELRHGLRVLVTVEFPIGMLLYVSSSKLSLVSW